MAKKSSSITKLKKMARAEPSKQEISSFFKELINGQSDHACVVLAASALDDDLYRLLKASMFNLQLEPQDFSNSIFEGNGPLSNFSSKIKITFALNLIDKKTYKTLNYIKEIRNTFAHSQKVLSFETIEVHDVCKLLPYKGAGIAKSRNNTNSFCARSSFVETSIETSLMLTELTTTELQKHTETLIEENASFNNFNTLLGSIKSTQKSTTR